MIVTLLEKKLVEAEGFYVAVDFGLVGEMGRQCLSVEFHEEFARLLLSTVLGKQAAARCCSFRIIINTHFALE